MSAPKSHSRFFSRFGSRFSLGNPKAFVLRKAMKLYKRHHWLLPKPIASRIYHAAVAPEETLVYQGNGFRPQAYRKHWAAFNQQYEPTTGPAILALLGPGHVFLDVGANVGYYTVQAALRVGPVGKVVAIEPHPAVRRVLESNLKENNLENVELHGVALGEKEGELFLHHSDREPGSHSLYGTGKEGFNVQVVRGDDLLRGQEVHVIKLDVEGAEFEVLRGLEGTIMKFHPALVVEFSSEWLMRASVDPRKILDWILDRGYHLKVFCDGERWGPRALPNTLPRAFDWHLFAEYENDTNADEPRPR